MFVLLLLPDLPAIADSEIKPSLRAATGASVIFTTRSHHHIQTDITGTEVCVWGSALSVVKCGTAAYTVLRGRD